MQAFDYIEIKVPAKPQYVGVARLAISGLASRVGFTYEEIEDLKIAASEAVTNAVQHAYSDEDQVGEVILGCALYEDRLEIVVTDHGQSFNFEETKKKVGPYQEWNEEAPLREGGLGLYLMEALMDEVKVDHGEGVIVFMTKYLGGERGEDHVKSTVFS